MRKLLNSTTLIYLSLCNVFSMSQRPDVHVFYASDEGFSVPTCVSIASMMKNLPENENAHVYVINTGMSEQSISNIKNLKYTIKSNCDIKIMDFDASRMDEFNTGGWSKNIRVKLFASELFPNLDKIVWIDGDTIVNGDIGKLYNINITDKYIAAFDQGDHKGILSFNDGIVLYNLGLMRKDDICNKIKDFILDYQKTPKSKNGLDGEYALTQVTKNKARKLPLRFNCMIGRIPAGYNGKTPNDLEDQKIIEIYKEVNNAVIFHYIGRRKPWNMGKIYYRKASWHSYDLWHKYCDMTPYAGLKNIIKYDRKSKIIDVKFFFLDCKYLSENLIKDIIDTHNSK